ncbi:MAG: GGDEF domain-containing protein [Bacilli bacterium]|nr:GGDEF domain-containing protein [Bacilli bacterium]
MGNGAILNNIANSRAIVFATIPAEGDFFNARFSFDGSDFGLYGLPGIHSIEDIFGSIYLRSEMIEGIGHAKYLANMHEGLSSAARGRQECNVLFPLVKGDGRIMMLMHMFAADENGMLGLMFIEVKAPDNLPPLEFLVSGSFKDRLTGLFNFQTFQEHLRTAEKDCLICLFDLNGFKRINDNYGHSVGDDTLIYITSYLISISTKNEIYYRRSGDEFMIMFLEDDLAHAKDVISKIVIYIQSLAIFNFSHLKGYECSAAFGLVEVKADHGKFIVPPETEIKLADLAMYEAKAAGEVLRYIPFDEGLSLSESEGFEERLEAAARKCRR